MNSTIRNEMPGDYREVEELTRDAFWNLYVPGCSEHYLAHSMRNHPDFLAELDFVTVYDNRIVGNIMYTKSYVIDTQDDSHRMETISFGPVSVLPEFQKRGVGSSLIRHSLTVAQKSNYKAVIILGHPHNYCKHGFKSSKDFDASDSEGKYPYGMLALELEQGAFQGRTWKYYASDVYDVDNDAAEEFDKKFPPRKKEFRYTQEEFSIAVRAYLI
ncbi:MAG: GNAT family N-acetyltransferase [Chitinivibrionales bacterium]|nr:GNAT family N-acetyltransferase [Chitinivibrionales bacterium]